MVGFNHLLTESADHFGKTKVQFTVQIGLVVVPMILKQTMLVRFVNLPNRFDNRTVDSPSLSLVFCFGHLFYVFCSLNLIN